MSYLERDGGGALFYEHASPTNGNHTFVFVNALTGNAASWQAEIGPALRNKGFGTLVYDMRGQANSRFAPDDRLDEELIVSDLCALMTEVSPASPIFVGLSIGGLFALKATLRGIDATGMVLINTLRKPRLALHWTNEAVTRGARIGGTQLVMDMFLPFLVGPAMLEKMREKCLGDSGYTPADEAGGDMQLLANSRAVDWDFPYESITIPTLIMTGLHDRVFYVPDDVRHLQSRIPNVRATEFPDAGHLIPMEDAPGTVDALVSFAGSLGQPADNV